MQFSFARLAAFVYLASSLVTAAPPKMMDKFDGAGVLYTINNHPTSNNIMVYTVAQNGTVSYTKNVPTGGVGAHVWDYIFFIPDALFSQSSVFRQDNMLFTVNAGSDTVSMFSINPEDPTDITLVGEPVASGGEFPTSVAAHGNNVCVLNGGKVNGVMCYTADAKEGLKPSGKFHALSVEQTTPPVGPHGALSQVMFSTDGSKVIVSFKGRPAELGTYANGYVARWNMFSNGTLDSDSFESIVPDNATGALRPFGMANIPGTDAVIATDSQIGVSVYDFKTGKSIGLPIKNQGATCWISELSNTTGTYFLTDFFTSLIYEAKVGDDLSLNVTNAIQLPMGSTPLDVTLGKAGGQEYLFINSANATSIDVIELHPDSQSKVVQRLNMYDIARGPSNTFIVDQYFLDGMASYWT